MVSGSRGDVRLRSTDLLGLSIPLRIGMEFGLGRGRGAWELDLEMGIIGGS
jgi:hypothetical protein